MTEYVLEILDGDHAGELVELTAEPVSFGRRSHNDVVISDENVSGHHATLVLEDGQWILRDLGSTNGTLMDGQPIQEVGLIANDIFQLGRIHIGFKKAGAPTPQIGGDLAAGTVDSARPAETWRANDQKQLPTQQERRLPRSRSQRPSKRAVRIAYAMWCVLGILVLTLGVLIGVAYVGKNPKDQPEAPSEPVAAKPRPTVVQPDREVEHLPRSVDTRQREALRKETDAAVKAMAAMAAMEAERKEAERKEAERKEAERKEAERKEAERKEAERKEAERKEAEREQLAAAELEARTWKKRDVYKLDRWINELPLPKTQQDWLVVKYLSMDAMKLSRSLETGGAKYFFVKTAAETCLAAYNKLVPKDQQKTLLDLKK